MTKLLKFLDKTKNRSLMMLVSFVPFLALTVFLWFNKVCYPECRLPNNFIPVYVVLAIIFAATTLLIVVTDFIRTSRKLK